MKIYLLTQNVVRGYDTYDSCVVIAESEEKARRMCPDEYCKYNEELKIFHWNTPDSFDPENIVNTWCSKIEEVDVTYLGEADERITEEKVICASFNAG